ncbi:MAG: hypothetical protein NVSMB31_15890 [Vulcanimicrobiaceae bacterium]
MDASAAGPAISRDVMGAALATWSDITLPQVAASLNQIGVGLVRWPGGSESDTYHWKNGGSVCQQGGGYVYPPSTFDNFINLDARPNNLDVAVTVNYGSNEACNGGGDPAEAAAWVAYARSKGYTVKYWTVGNEVFGNWEYDLHNPSHDAATYASAVKNGYYPQIKAADPNAQVGIVVSGSYAPSWDPTVFANTPFDFVEMHYYAQGPGNENDAYLLGQGVTDFSNALASMRTSMNSAGVPASVPIYVGELNTVYASPGKQSVSIVNGLFAGMAVAEMMKQGVPLSTWWIAYGGCNTGTNNSPSLYGWQNFGAYTLFSDGNGECGSNIPAGTPFPSARAYQLLSQFAPTGSRIVGSAMASGINNVRAYAAANPSGYSLLLFNLNQTTPLTLTVALNGQGRSSFTATQTTYGKLQYDDSKNNIWTAPVSTPLGTVATSFPATLPPWSISVITLR